MNVTSCAATEFAPSIINSGNKFTLMEKLKIAGAWSGILDVRLDVWTLPMLREELAKKLDCETESIKLINGGRVLKDGDENQKLDEIGINNNSKILVTRFDHREGKSLIDESLVEEERHNRLNRIKAAAVSMAKRHADGSSFSVDNFEIELEDQSGEIVHMGSETDQRAVMLGLMLHANGKQLMRKHNYEDALEILSMGEEAFFLCKPEVIELVDNVPILQIDMVWCYFMLGDVRWLSMAAMRLHKAREGIERSHGKDFSRIRLLQAGRHPELALHLKLELLEGVVAYHNGFFEKSNEALTSAQAKYNQLQVPDDVLSLLINMGYKDDDAKRALRMTDQEIGSAIDFLDQEKVKRKQKQKNDLKRLDEIMEQKMYGMTPLKKAVNLQKLRDLVSIGFEKELVGEALRRNENDPEKALDDLTNPEINSAMQIDIESKKRKRQDHATNDAVKALISMGFDRSRVVEAVTVCETQDQALGYLLDQPDSNPNPNPIATNTSDHTNPSGSSNDDYIEESKEESLVEERDIEMEGELTGELQRADALSDYDIDVTKEGEVLNEYLALLASREHR